VKRRSQVGQSLTEFALVSPVLFLMFLVILDLGRAVVTYAQLSLLAREAGRQAVLAYNQGSNTAAPSCLGSPCQVKAPVTKIQQLSAFGFPVTYSDSTANGSAPTYGSFTPNADPTQPGTINLSGSANNNTVYVFIYQIGSSTTPTGGRWMCPTCSPVSQRTAGRQLVVVDLRMKYLPATLSGIFNTPIELRALTVQRMEY
jgi:Flp pilus assembly protein TadG